MTAKLVLFFSSTIGSIALGYLIKVISARSKNASGKKLPAWSKFMKIFALAVLGPLPMINSFWTLQLNDPELFLLPLFGIAYSLVAMSIAAKAAEKFAYTRSHAAAFFVSVSFTNFGSFGGLAALLIFGKIGFALVMMANSLIPIVNYGYGYIISNNIAKGRGKPFLVSWKNLIEVPIVFIPVVSILIGFLFKLLEIPHYPAVDQISNIFVPAQSAAIGFALGLSLKISAVGKHVKDIFRIGIIKYVLLPIIMTALLLLTGMQHIMQGIPLKVVIIMMYMPVAFNSLIPPVLYNFDLDMVNSAWLLTSLGVFISFPLFILLF